ncbi:MAG: SGNH/GDSL hydrolase family protein [Candidatus Curtissbacteria bacterium]|nr:SGNH/GDSL hydrolase family protein [Candidatus Curtissbacteria bacterium]
MKKGFLPLFAILGLLVITTVALFYFIKTKAPKAADSIQTQSAVSSPTPTPYVFQTYTPPILEEKDIYNVFMVGDSMTNALGPRGGTMSEFINELYKRHNIFVSIDNYAHGSANILDIDEQLNKQTTYWDSTFEPLLSREFDLILVESFGYNPLSEFGLEEGIKRQNQALVELMTTLVSTHPNSAVVFVATIAPSKEKYAQNILLNIPAEDRSRQAEERMTYIKNHISFAQSHNIPVINIYEKSLNQKGDGNLKYINPSDYIHPSAEGIDFIGHEIANFIYENQILPR